MITFKKVFILFNLHTTYNVLHKSDNPNSDSLATFHKFCPMGDYCYMARDTYQPRTRGPSEYRLGYI